MLMIHAIHRQFQVCVVCHKTTTFLNKKILFYSTIICILTDESEFLKTEYNVYDPSPVPSLYSIIS